MSSKARKRWKLHGTQRPDPLYSLEFQNGRLLHVAFNYGVALNMHQAKLFGIDFDEATRRVIFHCTATSQEEFQLGNHTEIQKIVDMGLIPSAGSTPAETHNPGAADEQRPPGVSPAE